MGVAGWILGAFSHQAQRAGIICTGAHGLRFKIAIGLVYKDNIASFHDAAFDALQFIAARRGEQQQEQVRHFRNGGFGLPDANSFDQHNIEFGRFAQRNGFAGAPRDPAKLRLAWGWTDERVRVARQQVHAGFIAQNRPARSC